MAAVAADPGTFYAGLQEQRELMNALSSDHPIFGMSLVPHNESCNARPLSNGYNGLKQLL